MGSRLYTLGIVTQGVVTSSGGQIRPVRNSFVYYSATPPTPFPWIPFQLAFESVVWSPIVALLHSDYTGIAYNAYYPARFTPGTGHLVGSAPSGGVMGDRLPLSVAITVRLNSDFRGKNFQGLKSFGPVAETHTIDDELTPLAHAQWTTAIGNMLVPLLDGAGNTWHPAIESRVLTALDPNPLAADCVDMTYATVRFRLGLKRHRRERTVTF